MPKESRNKFDSPFDFPVKEEKKEKCKAYGCGKWVEFDPNKKEKFCIGCGFIPDKCQCYHIWRRS